MAAQLPVLLPGEFHGWRSLVGYSSLWRWWWGAAVVVGGQASQRVRHNWATKSNLQNI